MKLMKNYLKQSFVSVSLLMWAFSIFIVSLGRDNIMKDGYKMIIGMILSWIIVEIGKYVIGRFNLFQDLTKLTFNNVVNQICFTFILIGFMYARRIPYQSCMLFMLAWQLPFVFKLLYQYYVEKKELAKSIGLILVSLVETILIFNFDFFSIFRQFLFLILASLSAIITLKYQVIEKKKKKELLWIILAVTGVFVLIFVHVYFSHIVGRIEMWFHPDYGSGFDHTRKLLKHASIIGTGNIPNNKNLVRHFSSFQLIGGSALYYGGWLGLIGYSAIVLLHSFMLINVMKQMDQQINTFRMAILIISVYLLLENILSLFSTYGLPFLTVNPAFTNFGDNILLPLICISLIKPAFDKKTS